ncbi:hypothetical protein LEP1GSC202_2121 [Leptospira yanagawae serovar Saopaulo str. Sao Paulo = ATCC 700523]|uniref:Uncharacterized protein n=1 Tax=Leptospira yanagawae serovar Saopaulo str. Sao Paulo = ATCC 700523 TaxID=1249483 RepID=A0A5E8HAW6_9LEPT|nr:hypothetical protein [Leptospira yanagawae]EOQ87790.1 hypothetical protein LEP1GSC202_2121 [Leptospira yanagawae serovar Saopaulo str. Sao Paulo = ATCC 700523]
MNSKFRLFVLFFVSCISCGEAVGYLKYPIPDGNQLLLVPTASHIFSDHYSLEKEILISISEEFERNGFQVIPKEEYSLALHEAPNAKDHLERLEFELSQSKSSYEPKLKHWIRIAKEKGIPELVFVRFMKPETRNLIQVRLLWIHIIENEMERFDWNWENPNRFPFLKSKQEGRL